MAFTRSAVALVRQQLTEGGMDFAFARAAAGLLVVLCAAWPLAAEPLQLALPLDCDPGRTCFIQNQVDLDAGPGVHDRMCREASYDGHTGVDFRIPSIAAMRRGVPVFAAAAGVVKAVRDGVADRIDDGRAARDKRECGNGVVIEHGEGWETQYCHMRQGSIAVKPGDNTAKGGRLGLVGLSGATEFPHLHLALRQSGRVVDPFSGRSPDAAICERSEATGVPLFAADVVKAFPYRDGEPFLIGFAEAAPTLDLLLQEGTSPAPQRPDAPALLFYGLVLNLEPGDQLELRLEGPAGLLAEQTTPPMPRHKAQYMAFAGRKRRGDAWPAGSYSGSLALIRAGAVLWRQQRTLALP